MSQITEQELKVLANLRWSEHFDDERSQALTSSHVAYKAFGRRKEADVAREVKVKKCCSSRPDLRPGLFVDLSTFTRCRMILIQHIMRVLFKYVSSAGPLITSKKSPPFLTMIIMSQKLWFEGDAIPKVLVGILEEDGNDDEITYETLWTITMRTRSTMTINHHRGVQRTHVLPLFLKQHGSSLPLSIYV